MKCKSTSYELLKLLKHQLDQMWGGLVNIGGDAEFVEIALQKTLKCLSVNRSPYTKNDSGETQFHLENTVQYSIFLYYLANIFYKHGEIKKASFIYYLNKTLNCVELFYAIDLPEHFYMEHPLGSVMGRAQYGDYFLFYQGCTVGGNRSTYPTIGNHIIMYSNSKILGDCHIGNNVIIGANAYIKDMDIPDNSLVFGQCPKVIIKSDKPDLIKRTMEAIWQK